MLGHVAQKVNKGNPKPNFLDLIFPMQISLENEKSYDKPANPVYSYHAFKTWNFQNCTSCVYIF